VNRVELVGGLTRDPDLRALQSGVMVCQFTVGWKEAVWSGAERKDVVRNHYLSVVAWAELAEYVGEAFRKGDTVYVLGQLTQEEIEKADGKKESKTRVRAFVVRPVRKRYGTGDPGKVQQEEATADVEPPPF
jgi:single-strand DNA-binding protein